MTCECCNTIGIFDFGCLRCQARHYVRCLFEREQRKHDRLIEAEWPAEKIKQFQEYVEEERGKKCRT